MQDLNLESWELVALILERVVKNLEISHEANKAFCNSDAAPSCFDSSRVPGISIHDYMSRIHQYADCSDSCYTIAFIYIDRLLQKNPAFVLSMKSIHRLVITAVVLAIKYSDDIYADNVVYSKIGGVTLDELNSLERELMAFLRYELFVSPKTYEQYKNEIDEHYFSMQAESMEGNVADEMTEDCSEESSKPIQKVSSVENFRTMPSTNDMVEA